MLRELWIVHPEPATLAAYGARFEGLGRTRMVASTFEDVPPHDCFVTAGNAFGIMTAGIDAAVVRRLGDGLMAAVQHRIMDRHLGEQPVGTAFVIPTNHAAIPYLAHAPTMRVPGNIEGTDKVYAATWAALTAIHLHNVDHGGPIEVAAFPAMGTGYGGVSPDESARQMAAAYRHYLDPPHRLDWDHVVGRQRAICYDGPRQVVRG